MKRARNLFPQIISDKNLMQAIEVVNKSHRWHHYPDKPNKTVLWVEKTRDERVKELRDIINNGFEPSPVVKKKRYDRNAKKWREICEPKLWPDQYVHHALIQVIQPVMMRGMDRWCCGSIKKRGAHYGIAAIKKWMKNDYKGTRQCLEADVKQFYNSLQPDVVINRMKRLIKDYRTLDLIERIIRDGIQIGAYCSQWFANTFLQELDHELREKCGLSHYIRYMDNFTIFSNRKKTLRRIVKYIGKWLEERKLKLKENWQIFKTSVRMPNALGYRYGRGYTLMRKPNVLYFRKLLRVYYYKYESGHHIPVKFAQGLLSRFGMLRHCNSSWFYERFVKKKTQKHLKDVVRKWQKEATATWNTYLEPESATA